VALVTGGTKGIGAATSLELARRGADVAVVGRHDDESARRTVAEIASLGRRSLLVLADMGKPDDVVRCVAETTDQLGPPQMIVHSAGGLVPGGLLELTDQSWHEAFDVHVHAIFHLCRAAVPAMKERREGSIVLISSTAGIRGLPMNLAYQVVKGTLPQFTRALARELADFNIRVNCIAPGIVLTRFHAQVTPEQRQHNLDHRIPLHREGTPEQVATLLTEVACNDYITGETFTIDGGLTMRVA
jgi:NAD(P)-dependent dehydrogenase (short-subunit alcohol dehydrogenase family)